jgi:hypothetical protein
MAEASDHGMSTGHDGGNVAGDDAYGYLFAHFREEPDGYAERIYFSLSEGDSPLRWMPLWGGLPRLTSNVGTTGVRDPAIVRDGAGRFHILATDLRVWGGDNAGWDTWRRTGSRSLIVWDSDDLIEWIGPRVVEVAPSTAGMAWAPETTVDPDTGEHIVFWSSWLFDEADPEHQGTSYSRIMYARTRDFVDFTKAEVLVDSGLDIIDTAILQEAGRVYRFSKDERRGSDSWGIHQEVGSGLFADDFVTLRTRIGSGQFADVEAPMVVKDPHEERWYLFLDQYTRMPQGYFALETTDLEAANWSPVPAERTRIAPGTKHGTLLRLTRGEWQRLRPFAA